MEFNNYRVYCKISSSENKMGDDIKNVLELIDKFSKIKTPVEAKKLIKKLYLIEGDISNFSLGGKNYLKVKDTKNSYSVRISYANNFEDECVVYNFKKLIKE